MTAYTPDRPHMVTVPVSPYCELARWTLDRLGVVYTEECHAPFLHRAATRRHRGGAVVPVLNVGDRSLTDARQVVEYYEARAPQELKLRPDDALFHEFFDDLGVAVRAWAYTYQLPLRRSTSQAWMHRAPRVERLILRAAYPVLAAIVKRSLKLRDEDIPLYRSRIDASLARVEAQLGDGRRYLNGDRVSAADLAFATLMAPAVLPPEYRGPMPAIDDLPAAMRREVEQISARPAGQFALRLFRQERAAVG